MYAIESHGKIIGKEVRRVFTIRYYSTDPTRCHYHHVGSNRRKIALGLILSSN
jgi:hypothetical protein